MFSFIFRLGLPTLSKQTGIRKLSSWNLHGNTEHIVNHLDYIWVEFKTGGNDNARRYRNRWLRAIYFELAKSCLCLPNDSLNFSDEK